MDHQHDKLLRHWYGEETEYSAEFPMQNTQVQHLIDMRAEAALELPPTAVAAGGGPANIEMLLGSTQTKVDQYWVRFRLLMRHYVIQRARGGVLWLPADPTKGGA